jgi:hypothetical protein
MDCRATLAVTFKFVIAKVAVIANAVKQSMTPDCMDCRATLAVTARSPSLRGAKRCGNPCNPEVMDCRALACPELDEGSKGSQ